MTSQTHSAPGVYLDVATRKPTPSFETGVPAFLGFHWASVDVNAAQWTALRSRFGSRVIPVDGPLWSSVEAGFLSAPSKSVLGFAVRGFFENGGRRCYLVAPDANRAAGVDEGIDELDSFTDFDLVCAPDLVYFGGPSDLVQAQKRVLSLCASRGDCFAILDSVPLPGVNPAAELSALKQHRAALKGAPGEDSAALYAPWIKVRGACPTCEGKGTVTTSEGIKTCATCAGSTAGFVPPSGHVAGIYSRTDQQTGVHKAPANEALSGVLDLQRRISASEQDLLNPEGIDCIRAFPGRGMRVWGARTLGSDASQAYVNVRRLMLTIRRWLKQTMAGVAFEPHNPALWIRISREVNAFLADLYKKGALQGKSAAEAYSVKCDDETNPQRVRDAGQVVTEIGVAARVPGELIQIRLVLGREGAESAGGA